MGAAPVGRCDRKTWDRSTPRTGEDTSAFGMLSLRLELRHGENRRGEADGDQVLCPPGSVGARHCRETDARVAKLVDDAIKMPD